MPFTRISLLAGKSCGHLAAISSTCEDWSFASGVSAAAPVVEEGNR